MRLRRRGRRTVGRQLRSYETSMQFLRWCMDLVNLRKYKTGIWNT